MRRRKGDVLWRDGRIWVAAISLLAFLAETETDPEWKAGFDRAAKCIGIMAAAFSVPADMTPPRRRRKEDDEQPA